ncbi:stage II sporulation protein P [Peribacillus loiseleuriae]|uniref:stage II sporulation protein P n=1 Tax=Peribacillus loiseleuriae TaxID=1679170 RepID=UPI0038064A2B
MQTDKDLFDLIKKTYPLNPRAEFVSATEVKLRHSARKLNRKQTFKRLTVAFSGLILFMLAISWIFFFSGTDVINNTFSSLDENNFSAAVNKHEPLILINHTHNYESFIPEIQVKEPNDAFHESKNITLVGKRLSQDLNEKNINTIHDNRDIMGILKERGLSFAKSYTVSREYLKDTLENNNSIKMVFDIHRDSQKRNATTIKIKEKEYARIEFLVSHSSHNYNENMKFATLLHNKMEEKYPGLSRGVALYTSKLNKQNTYNQDLLDHSVLLEIGGVENTLEEEYRTADAFAEVIEEILNVEK